MILLLVFYLISNIATSYFEYKGWSKMILIYRWSFILYLVIAIVITIITNYNFMPVIFLTVWAEFLVISIITIPVWLNSCCCCCKNEETRLAIMCLMFR